MSDRFIANGVVNNNTTIPMRLKNSELSYGHWMTPPVQTIAPKSTAVLAFVGQGTSWTATGTQGWVMYSLGPDTDIMLCFDDPYRGSNNTNGTNSSNPKFAVWGSVPSSGSNVKFEYTVAALA